MAENFASAIKRADLGEALIPPEMSTEIIQTLPERSVIASRARRMTMSKAKKTQPVLASLPDAYWVQEGGLKETTNVEWKDVNITAEEIAVLVPIPDSVVDDADINIWAEIKPLITEAFGKKIDEAAMFGIDKPSTWGTDLLAGATAAGNVIAQGTGVDLADDIAGLAQKISEEGFAVDGFASMPGFNWQLTRLRDANQQPIYTPALSAASPSTLYGFPLNEIKNGAWDPTKAVLFAADWSKLVYGVRQDITFTMHTDGIISDKSGKVVYNAMQQDSKIMRVVMRVGFAVANPMTRVAKGVNQYPAGFITPAAAKANK